jgi:hypothetical protein
MALAQSRNDRDFSLIDLPDTYSAGFTDCTPFYGQP